MRRCAGRAAAAGFLFSLVTLLAPHASAEPTEKPFLWMIDTEPPSFLFGTMHSVDERIVNLPPVVEAAFAASDAVYTEIPMDMSTSMKAMSAMMLGDGQTLTKILPAHLRTRAAAYLESHDLPFAMFDGFRVSFFAVQLTLLEELQELMTKKPLDAVLYERAQKAGKHVGALEKIEEQLSIFTEMSEKDEIRLLEVTLDYVETAEEAGSSPMEELAEVYLAGDEAGLVDLMFAYLDEDDPFAERFIHAALTVRNGRMAERIDETLANDPGRVHFFAVGALHYPREDGVLALLERRGHEIERLDGSDVERLEEELAEGTGVR